MNTNPENDRPTRRPSDPTRQQNPYGQPAAGRPERPAPSGQPGQSGMPRQSSQPLQQAQRGRQVFAGSDLRAPEHPLDFGGAEGLVDSTQRTYLIVLLALLLVALLLFFFFGMGPASPIFFILALALLAGWLVF